MHYSPSNNRFFTALAVPLLAALYFAASKLGFTVAFAAEQVTVVWPPTGIALAAMLLFGYRLWPGIMLGAFLANVTTHEPAATACAIAIGNTLEAFCGAWMLRRFTGFHNSLGRVKDVLGLVIFSALFSTPISATIGVTSLCLGGVQPWAHYGFLWLLWWLGDATGALIFAPILLVWGSPPYCSWRPRSAVEAVALILGVTATCIGIFTNVPTAGIIGDTFLYLIFPFIIWAALRFGQHGTTFITMIASAITIWATVNGLGPFTLAAAGQSLALLQIFTAVTVVTGLLLSAAISERKQAEKSRARLAAIVESSEDAIIGINLDGSINFWNAGAERLSGYAAAEIIGKPITLIIPPDRRPEEHLIMDRVRHGEPTHYETVRVAKDGRRINISLSVSPVRDDSGHIVGASKVARDITERVQAEDALKEADRRKDEFLATLAHELRNPLAPLSNALHILQSPGADEAQRTEARGIMARQVQQMVRLVDDLLDVSRISHGKIDLHKQRITLADAIKNALETAKPLVEENRHQLSVSLPDATLWLDADLTRLSQLFANLLNNAAKYTPPGGQLRLEATAEENNVVVRVCDTGIGIPASMLPHVFDMFTQADTSIERAHGGLGIGLTLVRTLAEMHGGSVDAFSKGTGQGSEFVVRLPLAQGSPAVAPPPARLPHAGTADGEQRRFRILVTDDSRMSAKTLGYMLEIMGHDVRLAYDGANALDIARSFLPEVIFLDIGLPGMSGYEICRQLRVDPVLAHSVIIAQTGWSQEEHRKRSKESGFDYHLVKPVDLQMLEELLLSLNHAA